MIELSSANGIRELVGYEKGQLTFVRQELRDGNWRDVGQFTLSRPAAEAARERMFATWSQGQPIADEILAERQRQAAAFPTEEHGLPDGTGGAGRPTFVEIARNACDRAQAEGRLTHAHVLEEEAAEVLDATERAHLRKELVQLAAVCCKWVEEIDRRPT